MKKRLLTITLFVLGICTLQAQQIKSNYIIELNDSKFEGFINKMSTNRQAHLDYKIISKELNIILIENFIEEDQQLIQLLSNDRQVSKWYYDYQTEKRDTPNDEFFDMQWGLNLIEAPVAWELSTGGTDILGREIVIAVIDDGFELDHPELINRIHFNEAEIPNDNIDNDNNGYVDDFAGWNTKLENDEHPHPDNHGIAVMGIIGAEANNNEGISGVNWDIKLLPITGLETQAQVIAAYQYVIDTRRRFNETNGEEGAYIVAVNYSAGIDNRFGTEPAFESWCMMYDRLAEVGVLSTGATANNNRNVDIEGDIPTTCPSEFLIAVTNVDIDDAKVERAGFGEINIDLGAPGRGTLALGEEGGLDNDFGGTSAATPHVSGVIGLLYSLPCSGIADMALTQPLIVTRIIRDAIYQGVDPNPTLDGITATGGRLNILGAIEELQATCDEFELPSPKGDLSVENVYQPGQNSLTIEYLTPDETEYNLLITDRTGRSVYTETFTPPSFGLKRFNLNIPTFITGIYNISIYNDENIATHRVFIEQ